MVVFKELLIESYFDSSALSIGSFDGLHLGHLEVLDKLNTVAKIKNIPSIIVTFDPHPKSVLNTYPNSNWKMITSLNKKLELLELIGIDYVWLVPFNKDFAKISAEKFLEKYIIEYFKPKDIVMGYDHQFGNNRKGDEEFLNRNSIEYNYNLHVVDPFYINNSSVSSTKIRSYLQDYNLNLANALLGREYEIEGVVIKGEGLGAKMNFPTANICPLNKNQLIPPNGVYCVDLEFDNTKYLSMCNIGSRPTFYKNGQKVIEVHIIDNNNFNLLNKEIKVIFKKFLRKERKYDNADDLINQLKLDKQLCLENY